MTTGSENRRIPRHLRWLAPGAMVVVLAVTACDSDSTTSVTGSDPAAFSVSIDWVAEDRFGLDQNGNGLIDLPESARYVQGLPPGEQCPPEGCLAEPAGFPIVLRALVAGPQPDGARFSWTVVTDTGEEFGNETAVEEWSTTLPQGTHRVRVDVTDPLDGATLASASSEVRVDDLLVVALGDGFLSGEGAPEVSVVSSNLVSVGIAGTDSAGAGGTRLDVVWGDSGETGPGATTHYRFESVVPSGPAYYVQATSGDAVSRDHARARRSSLSSAALAARLLEEGNPQSSVTFVNLAAAGASLERGVMGDHPGALAEPLASELPALPPQLDALGALTGCGSPDSGINLTAECDRRIDVAFLSVGYTDVGVPQALMALLARDSPVFDQIEDARVTFDDLEAAIETGDWTHLAAAFQAVTSITGGEPPPLATLPLASLTVALDALAGSLQSSVDVDQLVLLTYPDPFGTCDTTLDGITPVADLDSAEIGWLRRVLLGPLNAVLADAASSHGWTLVDDLEVFQAGHGVCEAPAFLVPNEPGRSYPPALIDPGGDSVRWVLDAAEGASIVGGSKGPGPPTLLPNELGRRHIADALVAAVS